MRTCAVGILVMTSGFAGLTWELLWQQRASLALGVSARATAIVLACTMAGMALGAAIMGRWLSTGRVREPLRVYGFLELIIGLSGMMLLPGFDVVEHLDGAAWRACLWSVPFVQAVGVSVLLGPPALAMGATIPALALVVRRTATTISTLYGLNTAGAGVGVLTAAFVLLPSLGLWRTSVLCAALNLGVAAATLLFRADTPDDGDSRYADGERAAPPISFARAGFAVWSTGLATFGLEVAWFRSLRAAFQSTTDSFAIILGAVLVPLALGARLARRLPSRRSTLPTLFVGAGFLVLVVTPVIERLDLVNTFRFSYWAMTGARLGLSLIVLGAPMMVLGAILPWTLEQHRGPRATGWLYGLNTLGAVVGALGAAWLALPSLGFAATAWLCGVLLFCAAVVVGPSRSVSVKLLPLGVVALVVAVVFESGVGRLRVQAAYLGDAEHEVLETREGPDTTVSAVELENGVRELVIDGFQTSGDGVMGHYMTWMGRLPMLFHRSPRRALVVCFGIGQTADAVRDEGPEVLDVVELSAAVLDLARWFPANHGVLDDVRVRAIVMDGRAWLRRTRHRYDVMTLEPMSPHFAGTNALYSDAFYENAAAKMNPGGVIAQWLPLHLIPPHDAASIARTFQLTFPRAWLWIDPVDRTGILLGTLTDDSAPSAPDLPGLARPDIDRGLTAEAIREGFALGPDQLAAYGRSGAVITDDNQLLTYGAGRREVRRLQNPAAVHRLNLAVVERFRALRR